jgi:hypothetical protein
MSILNAIAVKPADVKHIINATFPQYRGRKVKVVASESVTLHDLNWGGGSRNQYSACTIAGEWTGNTSRFNACAPWVNHAEGASIPIPAGHIVVEHSIFCGRDCGLRLWVNPADMPKLLTVA